MNNSIAGNLWRYKRNIRGKPDFISMESEFNITQENSSIELLLELEYAEGEIEIYFTKHILARRKK